MLISAGDSHFSCLVVLVPLIVTAGAHEDTVRGDGALCVFSVLCGKLRVLVVVGDSRPFLTCFTGSDDGCFANRFYLGSGLQTLIQLVIYNVFLSDSITFLVQCIFI